MTPRRNAMILIALLATLALAGAACGSSAEPVSTAPTSTTPNATEVPDAGELPVVGEDQADDVPVVAGACAPGEPDCEDTLVVDPPTSDLPAPEDEASTMPGDTVSSGMVIDGGLTVSEALATDATGILAVKGHLFDEGNGPNLCESLIGLGERYGCDGEQISIMNFDAAVAGDEIVIHDGLTYTEGLLTLFGEIIDGSLVVDNLVVG